MSREAVLDLLERAAAWLDGLADQGGARVCPAHRVEHLGKTAYRIPMGLVLARDRAADASVVRSTALHLAARCRKYPHPEARAHLFFERWPDKWNCSNHLIDSGAACDALGRALVEAPELFDTEEREQVAGALGRCAETYLWAASVDKPVPAQCLWGALGMARAAVALDRADLAGRVREAVEHATASLHEDGSWSYYSSGGEPGSEDASAFYHSRCVGFTLEALTLLGDEVAGTTLGDRLVRALDFLLALHRADGTKTRAWEAKRWYFEGDHELASTSFDVHALLLGHRVFREPRYLEAARASFELLRRQQDTSGAIDSGAPRSFQCRTFWTAHTGLLASVLDDLDAPSPGDGGEPREGARHFPEAGLHRLERGDRVVLVRSRGSRSSPGFGGASAGGAVVSDSRAGRGERVLRSERRAGLSGEFVARGAPLRLVLSGDRSSAALHWARFSRWRLACERRASGWFAALRLTRATVAELVEWLRPHAASHFARDARHDPAPGTAVLVRGALAAIDGTRVVGTRTCRRVELVPAGLVVDDRLESDDPLPRIEYRLPEGARDVEVDGAPCAEPVVRRRGVRALAIRYRLP